MPASGPRRNASAQSLAGLQIPTGIAQEQPRASALQKVPGLPVYNRPQGSPAGCNGPAREQHLLAQRRGGLAQLCQLALKQHHRVLPPLPRPRGALPVAQLRLLGECGNPLSFPEAPDLDQQGYTILLPRALPTVQLLSDLCVYHSRRTV